MNHLLHTSSPAMGEGPQGTSRGVQPLARPRPSKRMGRLGCNVDTCFTGLGPEALAKQADKLVLHLGDSLESPNLTYKCRAAESGSVKRDRVIQGASRV